jgi:hypothetical protein
MQKPWVLGVQKTPPAARLQAINFDALQLNIEHYASCVRGQHAHGLASSAQATAAA